MTLVGFKVLFRALTKFLIIIFYIIFWKIKVASRIQDLSDYAHETKECIYKQV